MIGQLIGGRYRIESLLGAGGRGRVYGARDELLERDVALKLLRTDLADEEAELRFRREARTAARLEHPSIVPIYDFGREGGRLFLVMPRIPGESLRQHVKRGRLEAGPIVEIGIRVADALVYSHDLGVVHRDIKPENLMVRQVEGEWSVRLLDFGIAFRAGTERITREGNLVGTPTYLAPEQVEGQPTSAPADLYSLGVVLYECLTGQPPFGSALPRLLLDILTALPTPPSQLGVSLPQLLEDLILRCLEKRPEDRPANAREVREALRSADRRIAALGTDGRHDDRADSRGQAPEDRRHGSTSTRSETAVGTSSRGHPTIADLELSPAEVLIGRAEPLRRFTRWLGLAESRDSAAVIGDPEPQGDGRACRMVLIGGEAGIGKSKILRQVESLSRGSGALVLRGRFVDRRESSFPFHGFYEVIADYCRQVETGEIEARGEPFPTAALRDDLCQLFPMLEESSAFQRPAGSPAPSPRPRSKGHLFETLARAIQHMGRGQPLTLLLEDLHETDVSVEALRYIFRRLAGRPMGLAATFRTPVDPDHPLRAFLDWAGDEAGVHRLDLQPLSARQAQRLISAHLGRAPVDSASVEALHRTSGGNPLFLSQLVHALAERRELKQGSDGVWRLEGEGPRAAMLSESAQRLLHRRIDALPGSPRRLLESVSAIGHGFGRPQSEVVAPGDGEHLALLVERGFLEQEPLDGEPRYTFTSGLIRELAYHRLEDSRRRGLHRRLALDLERRSLPHPERFSHRLAFHWSEAKQGHRAVDHLLRAARFSLDGASPSDAIELAQRALELCRDDSCGPELDRQALELLARASQAAGRSTDAIRVTEKALRRRAETPALLLAGARAAWSSGELELCRQWVERALDLDGAREHRDELEELRGRLDALLTPSGGKPTAHPEPGPQGQRVAPTGATRHGAGRAHRHENPAAEGAPDPASAVSFERLGDALLLRGDYLAAREAFESAHSRRRARKGDTRSLSEAESRHLGRLAELAH
ncbi:MAG: protein kinase, partial [Holophagales bacterium]|nr:protein kinase [Holophagales bacterium]